MKHTYQPNGSTIKEKLMCELRHCAAVLLRRAKTHKRCRRCFTHGFRPDGTWGVKYSCCGCAEVETGIEKISKLLDSERKPKD